MNFIFAVMISGSSVEVAAQRGVLRIRNTVEALSSGRGSLDIGPGVAERAAVVRDIAKGVIDIRQPACRPAGDDIFDEVGMLWV